ncbi:hypothetical protein R3P38DRAFT_3183988 [Favolaschia claudopus]|uniref:DUF6699 domain-containing protein n=1 Tax=Favolaschia claudopus TaxID=2862362 RepID=A0AAW0CBE6_9AGAR
MREKHVRFSSKNTFYPPRTSSPLYIPLFPRRNSSRDGIKTPPPLPTPTTPHTPPAHCRPPLSRISSAQPKALPHKLLACEISPLLTVDLNRHLGVITSELPGAPTSCLIEPAITPPQTSISLVIPDLPWIIPISATFNGEHVAVTDVFDSVYEFLRASVKEEDFIGLETQKRKERAAQEYFRRCAKLQGRRGYREEKRQGVKKVDFLLGRTKFGGLSPTSMPDVWRLLTF